MHDKTLIELLTAKRLAERLAEHHQTENSNKLMIVPTHAWDKLMEAVQQVLLQEIAT